MDLKHKPLSDSSLPSYAVIKICEWNLCGNSNNPSGMEGGGWGLNFDDVQYKLSWNADLQELLIFFTGNPSISLFPRRSRGKVNEINNIFIAS